MKKKKIYSLCRLLAALLSVLLFLPAPLAAAAEAITTQAAGAIVMDYQTGEVYFAKEADTARPVASMTKLLGVYLVFDEIKAGRLALDTPVKASAHAAAVSRNPDYSGMEQLTEGQSYPVDTLLKLIMTASCNGSVIVLAEHIGGGQEAVFVNRMNEKAKEWGLNAHFADCCGIVNEGNAVTPRAMAEIARRLLRDHPEVLQYSTLKSFTFQGETFWSTNRMMREESFPGIDGLKTGTTSAAGHCFTGTASRNGRRIISVVLAAGGNEARITESRKLLEYGFTVRAEREAMWPKAAESVQVAFSTDTGTAAPFTQTTFRASVSGMNGASAPCSVVWEIGGQRYPVKKFSVADGAVDTLPLTMPSVSTDTLPVALQLTFPDGRTVRREGSIPVGQPLSFSGRLDIASVSLYPGTSVRIPCRVHCEQQTACAVPAGWYLDGQPIANYQNNAFACQPDGASAYTFLAKPDAQPQEHLLEFRVNPQGLPGAKPAVFSTKIIILSEQAQPETASENTSETAPETVPQAA